MARSRRGRGGRGYGYGRRDEPELHPVRVDLHVHTPYSADYQDVNATYLQILQVAAARGLDMIAITDHNTVGGIAAMRREIEDLTLLEELDRLTPEETQILAEYRRFLDQVIVLPGFEFTAAYGFHILGIFPPETSVRRLEHLLMTLGLTEAQVDAGSIQVNDTADVLTAYEIIDEFGGLVIPAHVNAAHGVAMLGSRYGEQTRIAYTQSPLIAALEVTDLEDSTRRGTAAFFNGTRTDYPRQMHLIQASDAHRLNREGARRDTDLGIGDRAMELQLPERSFNALRQLFASDDFTREHPYYPVPERDEDPILTARAQGPTITQAFHEQARSRRSRYRPVLKDVVAFANTNGGTIYIGMSGNPNTPVIGVPLVDEVLRGLRDAASRSIVPRLDVTTEIETALGKPIIVVHVPKGPNTPYATEAGQVFVRQDGQTVIALRDEIVQLVQEAAREGSVPSTGASGERHWTAPRPTFDLDEEESDGDGETDAEAVASLVPATPAPAPVVARQAPAPATAAARPSSPPVVTPARIVQPQPERAPAVAIPPTPPTPQAVIAPAPPSPEPSPPVEAAPASDILVDTVPGAARPLAPAQPQEETAEPTGTIAAAEPALQETRRPPRRRASRTRTARNAENGTDTVSAAEATEPITVSPTETHDTSTAPPVYSLEPAREVETAPAAPEAPSVAETGIIAEATGEEAEPTAAVATVAPAPRRRRRAPSKGKTAPTTPTAEAAPPTESIAATTDPAPAAETEGAASGIPSMATDGAEEARPATAETSETTLPSGGVEILSTTEHENGRQYTIRDLGTGKITKDVTRKTARGPLRQAVLAREDRLPNEDKIVWHGARGYGRTVVRDGSPQHDLALREPDGQVRIFYAVPNEGLDDAWRAVIPEP